MKLSSFAVEFPLHIEESKREYWLAGMQEKDAEIEALSETQFKFTCSRTYQLECVGWAVYKTALAKHCRVIEVSGAAEANASSYLYPSPRS